jgi:catechol 2,3-dioxygenase-like lactoylglutathione lyase family enzyme
MKRFHLHVSVENLDESIRFYSTLFAERPTHQQPDYAKWLLDDPRVNFAISTQRQPPGVNHLGFQVDSSDELHALHPQLLAADSQLIEESEQPCCYAKSDKYWVTDPTGIAWETFHTLGSIPAHGKDTRVVDHGSSVTPVLGDAHRRSECCVPADKIGVRAAPEPSNVDPCCATDAIANSAGKSGCGCGAAA